MGLIWVFRKAMYDARQFSKDRALEGADQPPVEAIPMLLDVLSGRLPLRVHARTQTDILTALRLADEFGIRFTLLEGTEAYKTLDELRAAKVDVIFGPIEDTPTGLRHGTNESRETRLMTVKAIVDAGLTVALSAQDLREEDGLARQGMLALRAGLTESQALVAMTETPARLLGISDRYGTLDTGKVGDLVIFSGPPFDATSRIVAVVSGGELVVDNRK